MENKPFRIHVDGNFIPRQACGVHKVEKVQFLKSFDWTGVEVVEYTYGLVMLDNGVVITITPSLRPRYNEFASFYYLDPFDRLDRILLLSEGKTFEFVEKL